MSGPAQLFPKPPDYMRAFDGEWSYYVHGHDRDDLYVIDDPELLVSEALWMRPVASSAVDESERPDDYETITRGPDGRFASTYLWFECREGDFGAEPFMGVRYAS